MSDGAQVSRPFLAVLSGPSGVGKDSVIQMLRHICPDVYYAVSMTTRAPRKGEEQGASYIFVDQQEFDSRLDHGALLAPALVHGNWYGVPVEEVEAALDRGKDVLLKIDVQGAIEVRRRLPQAVFIFLAPPSLEDLERRLITRHTESPDDFERRLTDAHSEMAKLPMYDYVVVNRAGALQCAAQDIACIITAERLRVYRQAVELQRIDNV